MNEKLERILMLAVGIAAMLAMFCIVVWVAMQAGQIFGIWAGVAVIALAIIIALLAVLGGAALFNEDEEKHKED